MVELQLPKLIAWVRFPSPAPAKRDKNEKNIERNRVRMRSFAGAIFVASFSFIIATLHKALKANLN